MADNDASGVATYSIAGAKLGYPILFPLVIITVLLGVTQEMGMRLTADHPQRPGRPDPREVRRQGVPVHLRRLCHRQHGHHHRDLSAIKTTSAMLNLPPIPCVIVIVVVIFLVRHQGQLQADPEHHAALVACSTWPTSSRPSRPSRIGAWRSATWSTRTASTLPRTTCSNYLIIGMGVLGTTITPWGQFFISSFAYDKKIEKGKINYSQLETYWGAFLTDFFSFFMIVATAATLFVNKIPLVSGEQAALAIKPFAGELAGTLFALGILNAGFMGIVIVSLSTAYAFSEFFGLSGSLDTSFKQSKTFLHSFPRPADRGSPGYHAAGGLAVQAGRHHPGHQRHGPAAGVLLPDQADQQPQADGRVRQQPLPEVFRHRPDGGDRHCLDVYRLCHFL